MRCPNCNAENRPGARFCGSCGQPLEAEAPAELTCPACGATVKPGARFCPRCGADLTAPTPSPGSSATPQAEPPAPAYESPEPRYEPSPSPPPSFAPEPYQPAGGPAASSGEASPFDEAPAALDGEAPPPASRRRRPMWLLAIVVALLSGAVLICVVMAVAVGPAFGETVPASPAADPNTPDITITVEEDYISSVITDALPPALAEDASLDVQPDNLMVMTLNFNLVFVKLEVVTTSKMSVESGRINVTVESVETGGQDILSLLGMDEVSLGQNVSDTIQQGLEGQLGQGAHLMNITTDDTHVILTARWD